MTTQKDVVLTGLRANAEFHLGNYLGGILPMIETVKQHAGKHQVNMFVPDLHSFITPVDYAKLHEQVFANTKAYVAAGLPLDNPNVYMYRQSYISAHSELTWILNCFAYYGEMQRMTQFKDKSAHQENVSVGLFDYPVLMAADILLYGAKWIPVGEDQTQHIEITRDLALRVNNKFSDVFPGGLFIVPEETKKQLEFTGRDSGIRIRSLMNPEKKMSKSISDPRGTILLSDAPEDAAKKVMSATTDSIGSINFDWKEQPGIANLLQILALLTDRPQHEINTEWTGRERYGELKQAVADAVQHFLTDFQTRLQNVDEAALMSKLEATEAEMNIVANRTLLRAQQAVGLRPRI